jgi:hypothetical protein
MMATDRGLDAVTCPPINALDQATRHPQSLPRRPQSEDFAASRAPPGPRIQKLQAWSERRPERNLPRRLGADALDAAESERAALVGER